MTKRILVLIILVFGLVLATPIHSCAQYADEPMLPDSSAELFQSLPLDVFSKGLSSGSKVLLRRCLAPGVTLNGHAATRDAVVDSLMVWRSLQPSRGRFGLSAWQSEGLTNDPCCYVSEIVLPDSLGPDLQHGMNSRYSSGITVQRGIRRSAQSIRDSIPYRNAIPGVHFVIRARISIYRSAASIAELEIIRRVGDADD